MANVRIATAGWAIPRDVAAAFPSEGGGLERYAARLDAVEINSTFYKPHRAGTFARWAASTPADFRFAVKLSRAITHDARLACGHEALEAFAAQVAPLDGKLGPLLIQLPPSLIYEAPVAERFFTSLREVWPGAIVCEPRHAAWFEPAPDTLLRAFRVARVAADPARVPAAARPGGWPELAYWRLHGSPRMYYSAYGEAALTALAAEILANEAAERWCVFDNTTSGAAAADALTLRRLLKEA